MKLVTLIIGSVAALAVMAVPEYQQASRLVPSLAPRVPNTPPVLNEPVSSKILMKRNDSCVKFFTFDELFSLNKKFFDNFIAPSNAIQVRSSSSNLGATT